MATIKQYQDDPYKNYLQKTKMAESGGDNNAKAKTSSALGSFQFLEGTWKDVVNKYNLGYTLADRTDPEKAEKVMRLFTQDNEKALKPVLGRDLTDGEKYLGHFLGIDGASNMFKASKKDPNMPVSYYISPKTIEANKSVFYNKDGSIKTTQQVYDWADKKMGGKVESYNTTQTTPTTPLTNFDIPTINRNFASVPDSPKEETKKEEKPSEALNQLKEQEFVKQYKSLLTQPQVAQQEQEVNQPIQTADLQGIFNQVSQFVDGDVAQQGGTQYKDLRAQDLNTVNKAMGIQFTMEGANSLFGLPVDEVKTNLPVKPKMRTFNDLQTSQIADITSGTNRYTADGGVIVGDYKKVWMNQKPEYYTEKEQPKEGQDFIYITPKQYNEFKSSKGYKNYKEGYSKQQVTTLQSGGEIVKDNNGYWNPNNWGKTVQIDGGDITMKCVHQILEGYSPETGERKLMFPNFDYKFSGAKRVIETPLKDNEIEFLKNIKK